MLIHAMIDELFHRDGIRIALSGRDEESLEPILLFIQRYITNPAYQTILIDLTNVILGMSDFLNG
jgi:U3 small nucleolar RNA-associated protein 15